MTSCAPARQLTAVVVGTTFGAVYAEALTAADSPVRLVGIVAAGSRRSQDLARRLGVPLYTDLDSVCHVDVAVVVVRAGIVGGEGSRIGRRLLERGVHVLQEQPVHAEEMIGLSRTAARHGVRYSVNDFYSRIEPVRQFVAASRTLCAVTPIRYVQARCAIQVAYPLFTLLAELVPRLVPSRVDLLPGSTSPFVPVRLTLDEVAVDLLLDNQLCATDPDNYVRLMHEVTVGTDAGELTLTHTHGCTLWRRRQCHETMDVPIVQRVGVAFDPTVDEIRRRLWPVAVRHAVRDFVTAIETERNPLSQRFVRAARLWSSVTSAAGPATLFPPFRPPRISAEELVRP